MQPARVRRSHLFRSEELFCLPKASVSRLDHQPRTQQPLSLLSLLPRRLQTDRVTRALVSSLCLSGPE